VNIQSSFSKNRELAALLALLLGLIIFFHVATALCGESRYRDQHIGTALHYTATHFGLKDTIIVGFNATDTPTIQELPVWQWAAGLAFKWLGPWWGWANIVSLILFLNCLYPLFRVVQQFYGDRAAWWALIFFLSQGLVFLFAGEAGTDGFCLCVSIWFWFICCRLLENPIKWFLPAAALGTLTAVSKLPFFMMVGLASFFLLLKLHGFKWRPLAALAGVGIISGIIFLLWTHYTDTAQANAIFPYIDLRLNSAPTGGTSMKFWFFGDWHYRLNPANWAKAAWRFANVAFGSFTLIVLFIVALVNKRVHPAAKFFLAGGILTTIVFTHLILHHYNYLLLFSPAAAILCAVTLVDIESFFAIHGINSRLVITTSTAILFLALFQSLMAMRAFSFDRFPAAITSAIRGHTTGQDKLIIINGGWGGDELIRSGRDGLSMWGADVFEDAGKYAQLKKLGFDKLVIVSQSPYQNAIQIVNPGETDIPRVMAKSYLTPLIEKWPTVYATDDIIIKDIP
jgi:hypothetical protein